MSEEPPADLAAAIPTTGSAHEPPPALDEPGQEPGPDSGDERVDDAAAAALARARAAAKAKGLRPGLRPIGKRRPGVPESPRSRDGRDPKLLGDQMDRLLLDRGWRVDVAVGSVMGRWPEIVG
ncbi:MAG TPA: hypothetical protein VFX53_06435, partial [Pedococcus sp.]|nr:hypothetical protein [Pedococcus sp.]